MASNLPPAAFEGKKLWSICDSLSLTPAWGRFPRSGHHTLRDATAEVVPGGGRQCAALAGASTAVAPAAAMSPCYRARNKMESVDERHAPIAPATTEARVVQEEFGTRRRPGLRANGI